MKNKNYNDTQCPIQTKEVADIVLIDKKTGLEITPDRYEVVVIDSNKKIE